MDGNDPRRTYEVDENKKVVEVRLLHVVHRVVGYVHGVAPDDDEVDLAVAHPRRAHAGDRRAHPVEGGREAEEGAEGDLVEGRSVAVAAAAAAAQVDVARATTHDLTLPASPFFNTARSDGPMAVSSGFTLVDTICRGWGES